MGLFLARKRRGRPATGSGETLYIPAEHLEQIKKIIGK
jgi:hypothetical protein